MGWYVISAGVFSRLHRAPHSLAERGAGSYFIRQDQRDLAPAARLLAAGRHRVVSFEIDWSCHRANYPDPLMYIYTAFAEWTVFRAQSQEEQGSKTRWRIIITTFAHKYVHLLYWILQKANRFFLLLLKTTIILLTTSFVLQFVYLN